MIFVLLTLLVFSANLFSNIDFNINTTLAYSYETNPLLRETNIIGGHSFLAGAGTYFLYDNDTFKTEIDLDTIYSYYKVSGISKLSLFAFDASAKNKVELSRTRDLKLDFEYGESGDLVPITGPFLKYKTFKLNLSSSNTDNMWFLRPVFNFEYFNDENDFFDRALGDFSLEFVSHFYPETFLSFYAQYGWILHNNSFLYDGFYVLGAIRLDGRFTKTTEGGVNFDYKYLVYSDKHAFYEPEIEIWFKTIISPKSFVRVSFERKAKDSFYSDFFVDTGFSLRTRTIFLDSWVFKVDADVKNRKYWNLNRRDIVFTAGAGVYYPLYSFKFFRNIALFFRTNYANNVTDAYGLTNMGLGPDPAINYNDFRFLVGITNKY